MLRTKTKLLIFFALILVFSLSFGIFFYFSSQKKSPEHSLNIINTAIKQHDFATFERHVDLENFYSNAFDDVIAPSLKQPSDVGANDFLASIMASVKQSFVGAMIDKTRNYIESGSLDMESQAPDQVLVKKFTELIDFRNVEFKKVDNVIIEGNIAYADVAIHHISLDENFTLKLKLRQLEDQTWSVVNINNMQDFLGEITKKKNEKLSELNKPLINKINEYIEISNNKSELKTVNRFGLTSYAFSYTNTIDFKSDKQIAEFAGQIDVYDQDKDLIFSQKFINAGPFPVKSKQNFNFSWPLNPYVPSEKALIHTTISKLDVQAKIIYVKFTDDSELRILTAMPGSK